MSEFLVKVSQQLLLVLAHSLWQGAAICLLLAVVLRLLPARRYSERYGAACIALMLLVVTVLATFSVLQLPKPDRPVTVSVHAVARDEPVVSGVVNGAEDPAMAAVSVPATVVESTQQSVGPYQVVMMCLAACWLVGVCIMLFRVVRGYVQVRQWLTADDSSVTTSLSQLRLELKELRAVLQLKRAVGLVVSPLVNTPVVVGNWRPMIVLPLSMLAGNVLSVQQWRIVLAHELAHVRRFDGLVNLAQLMIECLLFFNPFVWWISRRIRAERESCCDVLAVKVAGSQQEVAGTLLDVAELAAPPTAVAMAFAESGSPGSLRDRVLRLMRPDRAPQMSLTWLGLCCSLLLMTGAAVALQQGTDVAVRSAAALLSHQERVDELARLQENNSGVMVPSATATDSDEEESGRRIPVKVVVRCEDGSDVPERTGLSYIHASGNSSTAGSLDGVRTPVKVYERTKEFAPGRMRIGVFADGFPPAVSDVIRVRHGEAPLVVELILGRGFDVEFSVHTADGEPVDDVELEVQGLLSFDGSSTGPSPARRRVQITNGTLKLTGVSERTLYQFTVRSPGWEFVQRQQTVIRGQRYDWQLSRAQPAQLKLIDESGDPVEGARVMLVGWKEAGQRGGSGLRLGDPRRNQPGAEWLVGTSNAAGQVSVDCLSWKLQHTLAVRAEGYELKALWSVRPGEDLGTVELSPEITVSGIIGGDLSRLRRSGEGYVLSYRNDLRAPGQHSYSDIHYAEVTAGGEFEITDLVAGQLELELPGKTHRMAVTHSISDLQVRIADAQLQPVTREVIVKLTGLPDDLVVRGKMWLWWGNDPVGNQSVVIRDNQVRVDVPVGCRFNVSRTEGLVGCVVEETRPVTVTAGAEPMIVELPAVPAGAVHGTVWRSDGREPGHLVVRVFTSQDGLPTGMLNPGSEISRGLNTFFRSLPYGGTYSVLVREVSAEHYSWAVSNEFMVSADDPIRKIDLKLNPVRRFAVRVADEHDQPVSNAEVSLSVSHSFGGHSNGHPIRRMSDQDGLVDFGLVTLEGDSGAFDVRSALTVAPVSGFQGLITEIEEPVDGPMTIVLQPGVTARGLLIDDESGQPIPDAPIRIYPSHAHEAAYRESIRTRTDSQGRFKFEGLEPIEYRGYVDGATDPDAVVTPRSDGRYSIDYPAVREPLVLYGGDAEPFEWYVQVLPDRGLKPLTPKSE